MEIPTAICLICKKELLQDEFNFYVRSKNPLTFRKDCKECFRARAAKYRNKNHEKVLDSKRKYREENRAKIREKARKYNAREDVKKRTREYVKNDRQRKKKAERNKRWAAKPAVKIKRALQNKKRYYANINDSRKKAREYCKRSEVKAKARKRYHATKTPQKRLRNAIRTSIIYHMKRLGFTKDGSLVENLGYSLMALKNHLESLFEPWMSWENWGRYDASSWNDNDQNTWTWHIDHIKRHREFKYNSLGHPEFKECWALSNLRPLSAKENIIRQ